MACYDVKTGVACTLGIQVAGVSRMTEMAGQTSAPSYNGRTWAHTGERDNRLITLMNRSVPLDFTG